MKKLKLFLFVSFLFLIIISKAQHTIEVKHTYYTLEYDTSLKSPLISWYIQTTAHATSDNKIDRSTTATFHPDPLIDVNYQVATNKEYSSYNSQHRTDGLRFDKGHLSPFSAFNFDLTAAKESMYFTNTAPQYSFFNEHPWEKLERHILKQLSPQYDSIYVYTGCLYGSDLMNDVPVGSVVRITGVSNKSVCAKVLGPLQEAKGAPGLLVRISNSAAAVLGINDTKFPITVTYFE